MESHEQRIISIISKEVERMERLGVVIEYTIIGTSCFLALLLYLFV